MLTQKTCRYITLDKYDFTSEQLPKYADAAESFLQNWFYFSNVHFFAQKRRYQAVKMLLAVDSAAQTFTFHAPAGYSNDTARRKV